MTYLEIRSFLQKELEFLENGKNEARWILESVVGKSFSDSMVTEEQVFKMKEMVSQRKKHYPLEYLLGTVDFLGLSFDIAPGVLIPREDSAVLVEYLIKHAPAQAKILEIGVGSGILSLSLKKYRPDLSIQAFDKNPQAIECASKNEWKIFGTHGNIILQEADFFQIQGEPCFDILLSNPPYLSEKEWELVQPELFFEPKNALVGGNDGLLFYRAIFERRKEFLCTGGLMVLEISPPRLQDLGEVLEEMNEPYEILYDLQGQERGLILTVME